MTNPEEKISFEDIMATLDKDTASMLKRGSEISREVIPTASTNLNKLLGGGFRKGKQHTIWGLEQTAKTGFMLQTVGINQKRGENVAWIDAEHSFDPDWAVRLGVDPDRLAVSEVSTISELTDLQVKLIKKGFDIIVIDSTSALMPKSFFDKSGEMKDFAETGQLGQMAKDLGQMCKMIQGINWNCCVVHISQARVDVGSPAQTKPYIPTGGKEVRHTDSLRLRLMSSTAEAAAIMGNTQRGMNLVQEKHGIPVTWKIDKNKLNGKYSTGNYDFYIEGDHIGLDQEGEVLDMAITYGFVDKSGAWLTVNGQRFQGRAAAVKHLREDSGMLEVLVKQLNDANNIVEKEIPRDDEYSDE